MLTESQKNFEPTFTYEIISESSLPALDKLGNLPTLAMDSTSANDTFKYWNPATEDNKYNAVSHAPMKAGDQLIGESKQ